MSSSAVETQEARAQSIKVTDEALSADLVDGRTIVVPLTWFPRLKSGSLEERTNFEIIGDGRYIHWPDLDEDLTVAGLLEGRPSGESPESVRRWLDSRKPAKRTLAAEGRARIVAAIKKRRTHLRKVRRP